MLLSPNTRVISNQTAYLYPQSSFLPWSVHLLPVCWRLSPHRPYLLGDRKYVSSFMSISRTWNGALHVVGM